jgi:hypothetical protein
MYPVLPFTPAKSSNTSPSGFVLFVRQIPDLALISQRALRTTPHFTMSQQIRTDRFHRKPWHASWMIPELKHRVFSKANMGDGDYEEE